ncbi:MAG: phospholipase D family protein [Gammaproteobacteria bacterium]|nr:phospholipase D family protein [Gammaproteobacteria bacterium]
MVRKIYRLLTLVLVLSGCASLPDNSNRSESYVITDTDETTLGRGVQASRGQGNAKDGFIILGKGLDAFVARAALAGVAEKSLDVQYYLYHNDLVGGLFTAILLRAADRGVRVRLLVDDMDMEDRDHGILAIDNHPNIEIRIFNPFDRNLSRVPQFVTGLGTVTRRMHNKSFTADNVATILGGRNIGNAYFDADPTLEFADLDVLAVGDVVKDVSSSFDLYWNSKLAYPATTLIEESLTDEEALGFRNQLHDFLEKHKDSDYAQALRTSTLAKNIHEDKVEFTLGDAVIVVDHPDKISSSRDANELHLMSQLAPYFQNIKKELIIISPYFVPGSEGVEFFRQLIDNGVRVRILTNSLSSNDVGIVHAGYAKYREALLKTGVELYEMNRKLTRKQRKEKKGTGSSSKASLHAKAFILDREKIFIGSLNLDPRSFYENTEIGLILNAPEVAETMAEILIKNIEQHAFRLELHIDEEGYEEILWHGYEDETPVTFDVDPYTSFWRRLGVTIMGLLPIESQL